ncbi:hypothetical protein E2562_011326, partial [Oryza meyeriana var. granulata]
CPRCSRGGRSSNRGGPGWKPNQRNLTLGACPGEGWWELVYGTRRSGDELQLQWVLGLQGEAEEGATRAAVLGEARVLSSTVSGGAKVEPSASMGVDEPTPAVVVELATIMEPVVVVTTVEGASEVLKAAR